MASGFVNASNQDLDSVFAPWHTGWPQARVTDFDVSGGADLNTRYATLASGSAAAATKFVLSSDADLNTVFAALGTTNVQVGTQPSGVSGVAAAGNPSGTVTSGTTTCAGSKGNGSGYTYTWHLASGSGVSFTSGSSATTGVTGNVPAGQSISGTMFCTISDGVSSANTVTVTWTLQNTTKPITMIPFASKGAANYPAAASAGVFFTSDGTEWQQSNQTGSPPGSPQSVGAWDPSGDGSNYQIMATLVSGTAPNWPGYNNTLNSWNTPSSGLGTPSWGLQVTNRNGQTISCVLEIQIRLTSSGSVVSSGQVTLTATDNGET